MFSALVSIYVHFQCKFTVITRHQQCLSAIYSDFFPNSYKKSCSWLIERSFLTSKMRHVWRAFFFPPTLDRTLDVKSLESCCLSLSVSAAALLTWASSCVPLGPLLITFSFWDSTFLSSSVPYSFHFNPVSLLTSLLWVSIISGGAAFLAAEEPPAQWCWLAAAAAPEPAEPLCRLVEGRPLKGWWCLAFCLDAAGPPLQAFNSSLLLES